MTDILLLDNSAAAIVTEAIFTFYYKCLSI